MDILPRAVVIPTHPVRMPTKYIDSSLAQGGRVLTTGAGRHGHHASDTEAAGAQGNVQVNNADAFGVTASPVTVDASGNVGTTLSATTGELTATALVPATPSANDTAWGAANSVTTGKLYKMQLRGVPNPNGAPPFRHRNQAAYGAAAGIQGYPARKDLLWHKRGVQAEARNCIIGRIAASAFAAAAVVPHQFAVVAGSDDRADYDPLQMRVSTAVGGHQAFGFNPLTLSENNGLVQVSWFVEVDWSAPTSVGGLRLSMTQVRGGAVIATFELGKRWENNNQAKSVWDGQRCMMTNVSTGEGWAQGDYFEPSWQNIGTADGIIAIGHITAEWWPAP